MRVKWRSWLTPFILAAGLQLGLGACSSDGQQQLDQLDQQEDLQNQEDLDDDENLGNEDNLGEENNFNNFENAGFNNAVGGENNFGNNLANQGAPLNNGAGGEGDLQEIIEEMNQASNDPFAQNNGMGGNLADNQGMFNNAQLANNGMMNDQMMNQGMENQGMMNQGMDQGMMNQESMASTGAPAAPGLPELGSKMSYIVQKGDTLAKIATKVYGDPSRWTEIANFTGLANPRLIYPGDVVYYQLTEQSMAFAAAYESVKRAEVQIMEGDTLATIASRVYGSSSNWKLIWRQNDNIANPDRLVAGTTLYYVEPGMLSTAVETFKNKLSAITGIGESTTLAEADDEFNEFDEDSLTQPFSEELELNELSDVDSEFNDLNSDPVDQDFVEADFANFYDRMI